MLRRERDMSWGRARYVQWLQDDWFRALTLYLQIAHLLQCETSPPPKIRLVGAFDTVKTVDDFPFDLSLNGSIGHLRHALALHEDRRDLAPEYIFPDPETLSRLNGENRSLVQAWFAGTHVDVTGGSADHAGLSMYPLQWMLLEGQKLGLALAFGGNAHDTHVDADNPLNLVFPPDVEHGKGADIWSCTSENGICTSMQDLRKVHDLPSYGTRYKIRINPTSTSFKKPRDPFLMKKKQQKAAESTLLGYYSEGTTNEIIV